jgi:import receptor subunit TOM70
LFKEKGNSAYKAQRLEHAVNLYTRAVEISPKPEPVFYANRAACTSNSESTFELSLTILEIQAI